MAEVVAVMVFDGGENVATASAKQYAIRYLFMVMTFGS